MAKSKSTFYCQNCGAQSPKWIGKCPACGEWNTYVEEVVSKGSKDDSIPGGLKKQSNKPKSLSSISSGSEERIDTGNNELNRVLGDGLVTGSMVLIGGEPGIGKSTLLLQVSLAIAGKRMLYITGEESEHQIKMRAERLQLKNDNCYILTETNTQSIFRHIDEVQPGIVVIDSIQTLHSDYIDSAQGSISQIRQCAAELQKMAKQANIPVILIGHITKDGMLAGPKVLEHMVDTVLQFEGDRHHGYRILRTTKNRFGSTSEIGIYEMTGKGLKEVDNPSEILITQRDELTSGITVAATVEGIRPMLIETQALVSTAAYGTPQRSTTGFDTRRLNMLLAVLEKRSGFRLGAKDVFLNIAGGIRVDDPAIDMAVIIAVLSSNEDIAVENKYCFAGEVGLSGEIRAVNRIEQRVAEAGKLGFEKMFVSHNNIKSIPTTRLNIEVVAVKKVKDLISKVFG